MKLVMYPLGRIRLGENVRRHLGDCSELAVSIASIGLQQPLVVRLVDEEPELVQGFRRCEALRLLINPPDELRKRLSGLAGEHLAGANELTVPCLIFEGDARAAWLSQFVDTTGQRLSIYELGSRSIELRKRGVSRNEIAHVLGRSDRYVENCEAIVLGVCPEVRRALERNAEARDYRFTFDRLKRWSRMPEDAQRKEFFTLCPPPSEETESNGPRRQRGTRTRLDKEHARILLLQATALHERGEEGWSRVIAVLRHLIEGTPSPLPRLVHRATARTRGESSSVRASATSSAPSATTSTARSPNPSGNGRPPSS